MRTRLCKSGCRSRSTPAFDKNLDRSLVRNRSWVKNYFSSLFLDKHFYVESDLEARSTLPPQKIVLEPRITLIIFLYSYDRFYFVKKCSHKNHSVLLSSLYIRFSKSSDRYSISLLSLYRNNDHRAADGFHLSKITASISCPCGDTKDHG